MKNSTFTSYPTKQKHFFENNFRIATERKPLYAYCDASLQKMCHIDNFEFHSKGCLSNANKNYDLSDQVVEVEFYHPHTDNSKVWTRKTEFSLTTNTNSHEKIIDGKKKRELCA